MTGKLKKIFVWYALLNKRLFKKAGFLIILLLIPLLSFLMTVSTSDEDTGFLRVTIAAEDPDDPLAQQITEKLKEDSDIFMFKDSKDPEDALNMVKAAKVDAAWIIRSNLEDRINGHIDGEDESLVTIYETEENTLLQLSREKIFSALYPHLSYSLYEKIATEDMLPYEEVSEEDLREAYYIYANDEELVEFQYAEPDKHNEASNYLTSPIRGMCAILMLLCGLASTMYFLSDEKNGTYAWLGSGRRIFVFWAGNLCAVSIAAVFVTPALILSHNYTSFGTETLMMILFVLAVTGFCTLMGSLVSSEKGFGILLPLLLVGCVVFCPVFFDLRSFRAIQLMLAPSYYLYGIYDLSFAWKSVIYIAAVHAMAYGVYRFRHRRG